MRAGPLSSPEVVDLLNHYFVPVFVSMEDYEDTGAAPAAEKVEYLRIYHAAHAAGMSVGSVHVFILSPAGEPIATRHVAKATEPGELKSLLEQTRQDFKTPRGEPVFKPAPQSVPPERAQDVLALHLVSRYAHRGGSWNEIPAENWLLLNRAEWTKLLPPSEQHEVVGSSWDIDPTVSASILTHVYPQTENNDIRKNRLDRQSLKATVVSVDDATIRAHLDGKLRMKHSFYPGRDTEQFVDATILGYVEIDRTSHKIRALRIATDPAQYDGQAFGVAIDGPYP